MLLLTLALIIGIVVSIPWFFVDVKSGLTSTVLWFFIGLFLLYFGLFSIAGPLFGGVGLIVIIGLLVSGILCKLDDNTIGPKKDISFFIGTVPFGVFVLTLIINSVIFRATDYAALIPPIEKREWSQDFQPKDPRHFRVSSSENALFLARRAIGQSTHTDASGNPYSVGSQFTVYDSYKSLQIINNELWTIVPLDWVGIGPQQSSTLGVPGYIRVSAENPIIPAQYVSLPPGKELRYTPKSIFSHNLQRLVWKHHIDKCIADIHLEIDDNNQPFYIVSISKPTIGWFGEKVIGALIIDPVTGVGVEKFLTLEQIPHWVDRVESEELVHNNIDLHSKYSGGFINRVIYGNSVLTATETHFGYGSDGEPVFATGITADSSIADSTRSGSLVAVYYTNTRNGKTVEYVLNGGATEERAIQQIDLLGDIRNKGYHGTTPQLYNVYGHISYVVPIQNETHAFAGVGIVSVMNPQIIAWGQNAHDAVLSYQQVIIANSSQMAVDSTRTMSKITGKVMRINSALVSGTTTYFVLVDGVNSLFTIPMSAAPEIPITQPGDIVTVEYYNSGESVMPINKFRNGSIILARTTNQIDVQNRAAEHIDQSRSKNKERNDIQAVMEKLTPEERRLLKSKMK